MHTTVDPDGGDLLPLLRDRAVVLRHVSLPFDRRLRAHALLLAERLVELDDPLLVPVLEVRPTSDGLDLVLEYQEDVRPLPALQREGLAPGQVVTLGVALADALTALHDAGVTHGRLRDEDVLVRDTGEVLLTGFGVTAVLGSAGRPVDDLRDLIGLLAGVARVHPHAADAGWLAPVRRAVEAGEQDARSVRALLLAIGPGPQPLPGSVGPPEDRPSGARHRRARGSAGFVAGLSGRGLRGLGLLVPAALATVLLTGWVGATSSPEPQATRPAPAAEQPSKQPSAQPRGQPSGEPAPDWRAVLTQLDVSRAGILAAPDEARLPEVDAVGSSAYADDLAAVRALKGRHAVARGVRFDVQSIRVRSAGRWRADLEVVDALRPHSIVSTPGGDVLEQRPARAARTSVVTLVRTDEGWRIAQVVPR